MMNHRNRFFVIVLTVLLLVLTGSQATAEWKWPGNLTVIEEEAFAGNQSITGLIKIPNTVRRIGENAFTGTSVFALDFSKNLEVISSQRLNSTLYVHVRGNSIVGGFSGIHYLIAPAGSRAAVWARANGMMFVSESALVERDGFLYQRDDNGLQLLSAADGTHTGAEIIIPDTVDNLQVSQLTDYAFSGCANLQKVSLPERLRKEYENKLTAAYPHLTFTWYSELNDFRITDIRVDSVPGVLQETVTWTVETSDDTQVASYSYALTRNGNVIQTEEDSESAEFSATIRETGAYQLQAMVRTIHGASVSQSSSVYAAEETMKMVCPETLENGQDLEIEVQEVEGASYYSVFISEEDTGKSIAFRSLTKPDTIRLEGYLLDNKTYRISGYIYGNDFRYTIPTVRYLTVSGTKEAEPQVSIDSAVGERFTFSVQDDHYEDVIYHLVSVKNDSYGSIQKIPQRGLYVNESAQISFTAKKNGLWTKWSEPLELVVKKMDAPQITVDTSEWLAGVDPTITFSGPDGADYYGIYLVEGDKTQTTSDSVEVYRQVQKAGTYTLEGVGAWLPEGTLTLCVNAEDRDTDQFSESKILVTVIPNPDRPEPPQAYAQKSTIGAGASTNIVIPLNGADAYVERRSFTRPSGTTETYTSEYYAVSASGLNAISYVSSWDGEAGWVYHYSYAVRKDGVWSAFSDPVDITVTERESLAETVIHVPEHPQAGRDLTFTFDAVENATGYAVEVFEGNMFIWSNYISNPDFVTLSGRKINKATYRIEVTARDNTGTYGESTSSVTVMADGIRPAGPVVSADKNTVAQGESILFTIESNGADTIYASAMRCGETYQDEVWGDSITVWEDVTTWSVNANVWENTQYLIYSFFAFKDGIWSEPTEIRLDVAEPLSLEAAVFAMDSEFEAGEDVAVSIMPVENAEKYTYRVRNAAGVEIYQYFQTSLTTVEIEGYRLNPGTYSVEVTASAPGFTSSTARTTFTVTGTKLTGPAWEVRSETVARNRYAYFTIDTTGSTLAAVRYYTLGSNNSFMDTIQTTGSSTSWQAYISHNAGTRIAFMFAVKKEGRWTAWSPAQTITVVDQVPLAAPEIFMGEAAAGRDLSISFSEVENATSYSVSVYQNGNYLRGNTYYDPQTDVIPGYQIDSGATIRIKVTVNDDSGMYSSTSSEQTVSVIGERVDAPVAEVSKNEVLTQETFSFTVQTSGADRMAVRYGNSSSGNNYYTTEVWDEEQIWKTSIYSAETRQYQFALLREGVWTAWSEPITVTATVGNWLEKPEFTITGTEAGEDIIVTVEEVVHAGSYDLQMYNAYGEYVYSCGINPETLTATISGYRFTAGTYSVTIYVSAGSGGGDWASSSATKTITITGSREIAPAVTLVSTELSGDSTNYWTIIFGINDPDAEKVICRSWIRGETSPSYYTFQDTDFNSMTLNRRTEEGKTYCYSFSVYKNGRWTAWSATQRLNFDQQ